MAADHPTSAVVSIKGELAWRRGVKLAIELLEESSPEESGLDTKEHRDGRPADNIVLEYLQKARDAGELVEKAFTAVLSHFLSAAVDGGVPDPAGLEQLALSAEVMRENVGPLG